MFRRFVDQEQIPVFTTISLLTAVIVTTAVVALPIMDMRGGGGESAGLFPYPDVQFALAIGAVINGVAGLAAYFRGEYCGGRIAMIGIVVLFITAGIQGSVCHL
jgi:hypothetical protein